MQIMGPMLGEEKILKLAYQFEKIKDIYKNKPKI